MTISLPKVVKELLNKLLKAGYEAYVVGGAVRDAVLGKEPKDYDITTNALPEQVKEVFKDYPVLDTGLKHGTVSVVVNHVCYEVTTYRVDGDYSDGRHPDSVAFTSSLKEDLSRRDLTINALAADVNGEVVDYFGGLDDLSGNQVIIKAVGDPMQRLSEDALRIFRAYRFAARYQNSSIDPELKVALYKSTSLLGKVAMERVMAEMKQIVCTDNKEILTDALEAFFDRLMSELMFKKVLLDASDNDTAKESFTAQVDALAALLLMRDYDQHNKYHIHQDLFEHTAHVMLNSPKSYLCRYAALLHDVGKVLTMTVGEDGEHHFYKHPDLGGDLAYILCKSIFKLSKAETDLVTFLVRYHDVRTPATKRSVRKMLSTIATAGLPEETFAALMALNEADCKDHDLSLLEPFDAESRMKIKEELDAEVSTLTTKDLAVDGNDMIQAGLSGKAIGDMLKYLLDEVLEDKVKNDKESLIELVSTKMKE